MLAQPLCKLRPAGLVLPTQTLRITTGRESSGKGTHADAFGAIGLAPGGDVMLGLLLRLCAVTNSSNNQGTDKLRMPQPEMQGGKATHREPDNVRRTVAHAAYHICEILGCAGLVVGVYHRRHIGGGIAARTVDRTTVIAGKMADLSFPAACVTGKLVREHKRRPAAHRANLKLDPI